MSASLWSWGPSFLMNVSFFCGSSEALCWHRWESPWLTVWNHCESVLLCQNAGLLSNTMNQDRFRVSRFYRNGPNFFSSLPIISGHVRVFMCWSKWMIFVMNMLFDVCEEISFFCADEFVKWSFHFCCHALKLSYVKCLICNMGSSPVSMPSPFLFLFPLHIRS